MSPVGNHLSQLSCLKLLCQVNLICVHLHGQNRKSGSHTQWVTCAVDYFIIFLIWSTDRCICNDNRTEWSPIRSVIIVRFNKIY